jgi:hypothetical protein
MLQWPSFLRKARISMRGLSLWGLQCWPVEPVRLHDNAFLRKRGWREKAREELDESKKEADYSDGEDLQTWIDLHGAVRRKNTTSAFSR